MQHAALASTAAGAARPSCCHAQQQRRAAPSTRGGAAAVPSILSRQRSERHVVVASSAAPSSSSSSASASPSDAAPQTHGHGHGHGHGGGGERARPGEKKGFVEEMRFVAMKLHTKDQAPKEGQREAAPTPWAKWQPTRRGYLKFLNESKKVYEALEEAVASREEYQLFRNTGLERSKALAQDVRWFKEKYGMDPTETGAEGPGARYASELRRLAAEDPPAFVCHFYNVYFAHTAGGRMIGVKMADMLLERHALEFYKYPLAEGEEPAPNSGGGGDHRPLLDTVRRSLDAVAETWTREQKDRCLAETEESFKMSGALLRSIAEPVEEGEGEEKAAAS